MRTLRLHSPHRSKGSFARGILPLAALVPGCGGGGTTPDPQAETRRSLALGQPSVYHTEGTVTDLVTGQSAPYTIDTTITVVGTRWSPQANQTCWEVSQLGMWQSEGPRYPVFSRVLVYEVPEGDLYGCGHLDQGTQTYVFISRPASGPSLLEYHPVSVGQSFAWDITYNNGSTSNGNWAIVSRETLSRHRTFKVIRSYETRNTAGDLMNCDQTNWYRPSVGSSDRADSTCIYTVQEYRDSYVGTMALVSYQ